MTEINEYSLEYFNEYEVYDDKLNELAGELNIQGYNVLATAIEYDQESLLIVNETLRNYVLNQVLQGITIFIEKSFNLAQELKLKELLYWTRTTNY